MINQGNASIGEEGNKSVSNIGEHFIELLLGVELLILPESGVVISNMLPDFLIEPVSQRWDGNNGGKSTSNNVGQFDHYLININSYFVSRMYVITKYYIFI